MTMTLNKAREFAKQSAELHVAMLNALQPFFLYEIENGDVYERCTSSGTFHVYDVWSFLDRSAKLVHGLLNNGKLKGVALEK